MQRHRKKDRTERAPPTIQKYLHGTAGSPIGNSAPSPGTNENLYQSCVGGNATKTAACCRKDDLMFLTTPAPGPGSYPEDDPDCIEVYKEQQQKHDEQRHNAGSRLPEKTFGKWCAPNANQRAREVGNLHTPHGDALLHHHQHQEQQQQQQQLLSCHPNISSAGSAEYSYAYCEPMLLQRPAPTGDASSAEQQQLHTPVSTLSSSGSSYCVPVYAQRHQQQQHHGAPSLPLLQQQRPFRQPSAIRNPYQYTYGPAQGSADGSSSGTNTITTALHHHHHHHHHHSNYTLPNASSGSSSSTTTTTTTPTTTRTGSLRALFSNIFRKSSASSSAGHPSLASAAHSAPFLELDGSGTLQRSSFGGGGSASLLGAERHSFTTCYGTKENIYEDIGSQTGLGTVGADGKARDQSVAVCGSSSSTAPTGPPPPPPPPPLPPSGAGSPTGPLVVVDGGSAQDSSVAAERRRVQVQHDRIIGELNLSVERLIMPSCDDESVQPRYQEYAAEAHNDDCQQLMMMGQKPSYCLSSVATGGGGGGGRMTPSMGLRLSTKRHFPAAAAGTNTTTPAATSSSSPPPTLGVGSERHSPTVSYGKSYGDVDSGISSSSTSGTSYSSSILYRSITNYPQQQQQQQQQAGGGGGGGHHHHHHHHPQRTTTKHSLFNLHLGSVGTNRAATCCRGPKDASIASRPEGFVGRVGSTNAVVTNAPDPPPPPDTGLMSYACPTSSDGSYGPIIGRLPNTSVSSQTLTSCCFLSDHNLAERDIGSRPFAATFAYNHHHHQQQRGARTASNHATGGGGNFWARFRKLRLPITGTGGKLFSASSERQIDTELHLEDFTGESMWPEPGPRPVYHHHPPPLRSMQQPPPPPHQLALLPLDAPPPPHMLSPCGPTAAPLNGNLPPATHPRTTTTTTTLLHPFVVATGGESTTTGPPPRDDGRDEEEEEEEEDGSEHHPRQRSCSPSTPSSVASTGTSSASSSSSSSSVSPSSPMSPGSSSSCSSGATKHSGGGNESHAV
ncbi:mucin-19-like [Anopheles stephensi]|uniref:mucin-19-like n=1 Tax=Anopheles stephensi TaxID=30069 RepID=UPI0007D37CAE|nr:mucin-19-like [Anopheles stephensi]